MIATSKSSLSSSSRQSLYLFFAALQLVASLILIANAQQQQQQAQQAPTSQKRQAALTPATDDEYLVGVGIADITGPSADINLMGYAKPTQDAGGIHLRQFSRALVMEDAYGTRLVYINLDNGMVTQLLRTQLMRRLADEFGAQTYNESNVMLSATHTHSGPGGYFQYMLYNIPSAGYIAQTLEALLDGIQRSVRRAHESMQPGRVYYHKGELVDASVNRSPYSYANNPQSERQRYKHDTDKEMFLLRFVDRQGQPVAMLNWFAVHGTSMNNSNHLISSDNKGYAALLFEEEFNRAGPASSASQPPLPGKGNFVAMFAQANEGDVSPNTRGPRCIDTGLPCDLATSTCGNPPRNEKCIASGPGRDMFESTKIIAHKQYNKARQLFLDTANQKQVRGPLRFIHEYIDITKQQVPLYRSVVELAKRQADAGQPAAEANGQTTGERLVVNRRHRHRRQDQPPQEGGSTQGALLAQSQKPAPVYTLNATYQTCVAALGYSFAAGTTDGPGAFDFQQGDTVSSRYWNMVRNALRKPSAEQIKCHHPKPILLSTGEMDFPYMWHPKVVPTQIFVLGQIAIVGLPGEFTSMSGRRVREAVKSTLRGLANDGQQMWHQWHGSAGHSGSSAASALAMEPAQPDRETGLSSDEARRQWSRLSEAAASREQQKRSSSAGAETTAAGHTQDDYEEVVLSGLSNIYTSYCATLEEYQLQRYESASTLYGPHTLQAYINQFTRLARVLATTPNTKSYDLTPASLRPPDLTKSLFTLKPGVIFDGVPHGKSFGDVLADVDPQRVYKCREQVSVTFVAGNPRNDLKQEQSFLYVDKFDARDQTWLTVATDASWQTKFIWQRTNTIFGESQATVHWDIPDQCEPGVYRIRHLGAHKNLFQKVSQYSGKSSLFKVASSSSASEQATQQEAASQEARQLEALIRLAEQAEAQAASDGQLGPDQQQAASPKSDHRQPANSMVASLFQFVGSIFRRKSL